MTFEVILQKSVLVFFPDSDHIGYYACEASVSPVLVFGFRLPKHSKHPGNRYIKQDLAENFPYFTSIICRVFTCSPASIL